MRGIGSLVLALLLALSAAPLAANPAATSAAASPVAPMEEAFLLYAPEARALGPETLEREPRGFGFPPGERIEFDVSYLGVPVGRLSVEVAAWRELEGRRLAHVVARARTNAVFDGLYRVDDRSEAWIDVDSGRTLQTATRTRHGRRGEVYEEVAFDWDAHLVHVLEDKRWKRTREMSLDFGPDVYDTFETFYAVRSLPFAAGVEWALPVYASFKVYGLDIAVARSEPAQSDVLGAVDAWVLHPRNHLDGELQGDGQGEIWVAADGRHVPVAMRGWIRSYGGLRIAGLSGRLVSYEPGLPGWEALEPRALEPRHAPPTTRKGSARWRVSEPVRAARAELGLEPVDRRHTDVRIEEIAACNEIPMLSRFVVAPGEPGVSAAGCPKHEGPAGLPAVAAPAP